MGIFPSAPQAEYLQHGIVALAQAGVGTHCGPPSGPVVNVTGTSVADVVYSNSGGQGSPSDPLGDYLKLSRAVLNRSS